MRVESRESAVECRKDGEEQNCLALRLPPYSFRLPPSPFRLRRAITLTEVLISMGILTLGLLGVAALFPVGGFYMQKAEVADRGSAIAQSVMNDVMARGMLNPGAWFVMVPSPATTPINSVNYLFPGIDGKYAPSVQRATFTRPFAETLSGGLKLTSNSVTISRQFGNAYVIDPMYVAAAVVRHQALNNFNPVAYPFPASALNVFPSTFTNAKYCKATQWDPWRTSANSGDRIWPVRRVTFQDTSGWSMNATIAESYFRGIDDVSTDLPARDDRPVRQNWDAIDDGKGGKTALAPQWAGDYSWIVSVVPTTNAARDGMARNPEGYAYDVSVVVFYKRLLPTEPAANTADTKPARSYERSVAASIVSTGLNGGEILLTDIGEIATSSAFEHLKIGHWIMLCGPHPNSNVNTTVNPPTGEPRFVMNWYQVLSIESDNTGILGFDPKMQRLVAVRGPEWPWLPQGNPVTDITNLSNSLCVAICRGAVAVHTKTMRLENPRGGAWGSAMTPIPPPTDPNTKWWN